MRHPGAITQAALDLRRSVPTPTEARVLMAGLGLRRARGVLRGQYSSEEVELVARARVLALRGGQIKLSRYLTLRVSRQKKYAWEPGKSFHECPKCGRVHKEPKKRATKKLLAEEATAIREAAARAGVHGTPIRRLLRKR